MGGEEEEEVGRRKKRRSPINMGRLLEKGETVTLWDGGHRSGEGGARQERSCGGSLRGRVCREVGCVCGETQGLLAWVLVEALFSTWMIITQCQLHILPRNCTYAFGIFL